VIATVERLPVVAALEPEVGATVDDESVVRELRGDLGGGSVRQAQEDDIVTGEGRGVGVTENPIGKRDEVRLVLTEKGPGVARCRDSTDLHVGMGEESAQHFPADIPAGTRDRDSD
jgi:hypothetical protein